MLKLAGEADIIPTVLTRCDALLDLGRTRRVASPQQTYGLIARDTGCSFPGCAASPEWCERHHLIPWAEGGPTSVDNLTLLCRYHHHNFASRGWTCQMNPDRLPTWIPPAWIDPDRRPLMNNRIVSRHGLERRRRARTRSPAPADLTGQDLVSAQLTSAALAPAMT